MYYGNSSASAGSSVSSVLGSNLSAFWNFQEGSGTPFDKSGNGHTGTLNGNTTYGDGKYGKGLSFDGTEDSLSAGDSYTQITWKWADNSSGQMTGGADTWEKLTVSGTPSGKGVLFLKVEGFSTAVGAKYFVDDIQISQP